MSCDLCGQELIPLGTACGQCEDVNCDHHQRPAPYPRSRCMGCFSMAVNLEKYIIQKTDRTIMGEWTTGWLREILKDPRRYL